MTHTDVQCEGRGEYWEFDANEDPVIMMPFPHWECPSCGFWIPAF